MARGVKQSAGFAALFSLALHGGLLAFGAWQRRGAPPEPHARELEVQLEELEGRVWPPEVKSLLGQDRSAEPPEELDPSARGAELARPDQARRGRGGEALGAAVNLSDSVDDILLERDTVNHPDRTQVQRVATSTQRRSEDDRRATPSPMELSFLATGRGRLAERRPPASHDPARGSRHGQAPTRRGGPAGHLTAFDSDSSPDGELAARGAPIAGGTPKQALGAAEATARGYRLSAAVELARPRVPRARAAVPSRHVGRPEDTQDSSQEVAQAVRSLIQASQAGGLAGSGRGGTPAPNPEPGAGGPSGPGASSRQAGAGGHYAGGRPRGLTSYFSALERSIDWQGAFPAWAIAEGRSGVAIVSFTLGARGELLALAVSRPSGVPEFDAGVLDAIRRAAPFGAPPKGFGTPLPIRMTFDALNPAVGRGPRER
ncbi:MAG: TonB C-terminal domain-containing protein [Polyangiaceae bacterium]|nr:TonB C-terminal domain-containing protein [Polyangiaceae bacterium]